ITHVPQLILGLVFRLEKTFGEDGPLAVGDPDGPGLIHADGDGHRLSPLPHGQRSGLPPGEGVERRHNRREALRRGWATPGERSRTASDGVRGTHGPVCGGRPRPLRWIILCSNPYHTSIQGYQGLPSGPNHGRRRNRLYSGRTIDKDAREVKQKP